MAIVILAKPLYPIGRPRRASPSWRVVEVKAACATVDKGHISRRAHGRDGGELSAVETL